MKILLINKFHYLRGGAERAYFDTANILAKHGHEVAFFSMNHPSNEPSKWSEFFVDNIDYREKGLGIGKKIISTLRIWYNFQAANRLEALLKKFKPDVAHLHNIYHQLSPSIINVLKKHGIPMVMTLHDYKLICPNYSLLVRGQIWERSKQNKYYFCLKDKCVDNSFFKSLVCTIEAYLHKFWKVYSKVNLFISPSQFLISKFQEFGFKKEIVYLPNPFLAEEIKETSPSAVKKKYILYYGRISEEKGIADLLRAYGRLKTNISLNIVGTGPAEKELKNIVSQEKISNVNFLGYRTGAELWRQVRGAELVVVPSKWYENAPYIVVEVMALKKIVLASRLGGLKEMIQDGVDGFLFEPGNIEDLKNKIEYILSHPELQESIGEQAGAAIKDKNDREKYYQNLKEVYERAMKM